MYSIKTKHSYDNFNNNKKMFDFSNYSAKLKYYNDSNASLVGKIKIEIGGVAIEKFVD